MQKQVNTDLVAKLVEWQDLIKNEDEVFKNQCLTLFLGMVRRGDRLPDRIWLEPSPQYGVLLKMWWHKANYNVWHMVGESVILIEEPEDLDEDNKFQGNQTIPLSYWEGPSGNERLEQWHRKYYSFTVHDSAIDTPCVVLKTPFQQVDAEFDDWNSVSPLPATIDRMIENAMDKFDNNRNPRRYRVFCGDWPKHPVPEPEAYTKAHEEITRKLSTVAWPVVSIQKWGNTDNYEITIDALVWQGINEALVWEAMTKAGFRVVEVWEYPLQTPKEPPEVKA